MILFRSSLVLNEHSKKEFFLKKDCVCVGVGIGVCRCGYRCVWGGIGVCM